MREKPVGAVPGVLFTLPLVRNLVSVGRKDLWALWTFVGVRGELTFSAPIGTDVNEVESGKITQMPLLNTTAFSAATEKGLLRLHRFLAKLPGLVSSSNSDSSSATLSVLWSINLVPAMRGPEVTTPLLEEDDPHELRPRRRKSS
jgi:hypothetical protein